MCVFRPLIIKTSQPRGVYYWGPSDFVSLFILGLLNYYSIRARFENQFLAIF